MDPRIEWSRVHANLHPRPPYSSIPRPLCSSNPRPTLEDELPSRCRPPRDTKFLSPLALSLSLSLSLSSLSSHYYLFIHLYYIAFIYTDSTLLPLFHIATLRAIYFIPSKFYFIPGKVYDLHKLYAPAESTTALIFPSSF
jgi:hypothetical protein